METKKKVKRNFFVECIVIPCWYILTFMLSVYIFLYGFIMFADQVGMTTLFFMLMIVLGIKHFIIHTIIRKEDES
jgi:hypothetical protein